MVVWGLVVEVRVKVLLRLRAPVRVVVSVTARVLWRVAAPSMEVVPPNKVVPPTASVNDGVVVAMPKRLVEVLTVMVLVPVADSTSNALPDEVAIRRGSETIKEPYCPPITFKVVV